MVDFTKTTVQRDGTVQDESTIYNISATIVNNELTRLYCGITKKSRQDETHNDQMTGDIPVGHITLEYGRQVTEFTQGENLIPHLIKFQEILDEVLGKNTSEEVKS